MYDLTLFGKTDVTSILRSGCDIMICDVNSVEKTEIEQYLNFIDCSLV